MEKSYLLRLANYEYFISIYLNTGEYYKSAHQILADLEKEVCYSNQEQVFISYKDDGDCIFSFDRYENDGYGNNYVVYNFDCTAV